MAPSMSQRAHYFTASSKRLVPYYLVEIASHVYNQSWLMTKAVPTNNNYLCWLVTKVWNVSLKFSRWFHFHMI